MTGYVRKDTTNNIADGNVINAADLDAEFDGVQDAFNASTGHKHDGTAGEGATINALGPTQDVTISSTLLAPKTTNTVDIGSSSLKFKDLFLAGNGSVGGTLAVTGVATFTAQPILSSLTASRAVFSDGSKGLVSNAITGTGNVVMSASPTLTGTAGFENITASGTLGVTGVATFTAQPIVSSLTASRAVFSDGSKGLVSNAITGTGNVVMSASPTLTGTISAEALTASSSVTLSGGTANGVAYLNGSKVLTSGSALTFNGTSLGVGSSSYGDAGTISLSVGVAGSTTGGLQLWGTTTTEHYIQWGDSTTGSATYAGAISYSHASDFMRFWTSSTEQMRLTSTGLGIGTSSPAYKLDVQTTNSSNPDGITVRSTSSSSSAGAQLILNGYGNSWGIVCGSTARNSNALTFSLDALGTPSEKMRLDSAGNLGLGTAPSAWISTNKAFQFGYGAVRAFSNSANTYLDNNNYVNSSGTDIYLNNGFAGRYRIADNQHIWYQAASGTAGDGISFSQAMTLDASGNLSVGTTSADNVLNLGATSNGRGITWEKYANVFAEYSSGNIYLSSNYYPTVGSAGYKTSITATFGAAGISVSGTGGTSTGGVIQFFVDPATSKTAGAAFTPTERARIDSSGNLGLGVTPSAWYGYMKAVQFGDTASYISSYTSSITSYQHMFLGNNGYMDSTATWLYSRNRPAAQYYQENNTHKWLIAPSGTAGDAISFTQAMTLDASGNLVLGDTSAGGRLKVTGANTTYDTNCFGQVLVQSTTAYNATPRAGIAFSVKYNSSGDYTAGGCTIQSFRETATDGDFATGLLFTTQAFGVAPSEKARITSDGNLLVGTTSAGGNGWTLYPTGSGGGVLTVWNRPTTASTTTALEFRDGGTAKGSITYTNTATAFNTSSDYRLKNTIAPMTGALAKVALLKPCTYKWNADGSDGEGFIAHELAEVVPHAVTGEKDAVDEDGNPKYQGIDTSFLVATLTAAIQELKAEFDAYKASHP